MIIGHLPAGYLISRACAGVMLKWAPTGTSSGRLLLAGSLAAIAPDLDMIYFYLIDRGGHLHHSYWTHLPIFWAGLAILAITITVLRGHRIFIIYTLVVMIGISSHLLLDTITGGIRWFYPFSQKYFALFQVASLHKWWVLNFVFNWTFLLELVLVMAACWTFLHRRCQSTSSEKHRRARRRAFLWSSTWYQVSSTQIKNPAPVKAADLNAEVARRR